MTPDNNIDFSVMEEAYKKACEGEATPSDAFVLCSDGELHSVFEDDPPQEVLDSIEYVKQNVKL